MRSGLTTLMIKEIKELLRDPKILLGMVLMPLLIFPILGAAINVSQRAVEKSIESTTTAVLDLDNGTAAQNLTTFLELAGKVTPLTANNVTEALESLQGTNITALIVIPLGFSQNMTDPDRKGAVELHVLVKSLSIAEAGKSAIPEELLRVYEEFLVRQAVNATGQNPEKLLDPMSIDYFTIFRGESVEVPPSALTVIAVSQSMVFPLAIMLLLITGMQVAATSIAIEKEEKTLETLLTLPVGRLTILTGKLGGSVVVATAGAIAAMIGASLYASTIFGGAITSGISPEALQTLGLVPSPVSLLLVGLTVFVTIVSALALAICIAVFAGDVRSAQSLIGYLIIPIVVPTMILMFADINILPTAAQIVLYVIPYTHSIVATKAALIGDYLTVSWSLLYISAFTVVLLYVAAKIFTTERVVTARISLRKFRRKR